jgi:hypothetical protein
LLIEIKEIDLVVGRVFFEERGQTSAWRSSLLEGLLEKFYKRMKENFTRGLFSFLSILQRPILRSEGAAV